MLDPIKVLYGIDLKNKGDIRMNIPKNDFILHRFDE